MTGRHGHVEGGEVEDAERVARWLREETETFYVGGCHVAGAVRLREWVRKLGEREPPSDIEFAVAPRDRGELIGENGLHEIAWVARTAETGSYVCRLQHGATTSAPTPNTCCSPTPPTAAACTRSARPSGRRSAY